MTHGIDEIRLQAYLDGELDCVGMTEMDELIKSSDAARRYVLEAVRSKAHLKAEMNTVLEEDIPHRLLETINGPAQKDAGFKIGMPQTMQVAAAVVLLFVGLGSGMLLGRGEPGVPAGMVGYIPANFTTVVEDALEHSLRGTRKQWRSDSGNLAAVVTPAMTYRDKNGVYYRQYHLEMTVDNEHRHLEGLAYRTPQGHWKTKILYLDDNPI